MLGPDSKLLTLLLIGAAIALLVGLARFRMLPVRILCGTLALAVAMAGGVATVNYYYGYYTSWSQLWSDVHGSAGNLGVVAAGADTSALQSGSLRWIRLAGKVSGYDRQGLLYLPPQYNEPEYSKVRFPVVELFHGTPGKPITWDTALHIDQVANSLVSRHLMGPMVLVMPSTNGTGNDYQDCVNSRAISDETYLTSDVRTDIFAHYRVSRDAYSWGLGGYSSGGYCAANLALRHRSAFGAAAVINGYFRAADGPAGQALQNNQALEVANSPLYLAEKLPPDASPLPAFWVAAGANDRTDYPAAVTFTEALNRVEQVPFARLKAGDTANAWQAALPTALMWLWQQLATPDLKATFPVRAAVADSGSSTLPVQPLPQRAPAPCKAATSGTAGVTGTAGNAGKTPTGGKATLCARPVLAKPTAASDAAAAAGA